MDDIDIFEPDALDRSVEAYENLPLPAQIAAGFTPAGLAADVATAAKYGRDAVRQLVAGKYGEAAAPAILAALAGVGLIPVVGDIAKKYGSRAVKDSFQPKGRVLGDVYDQELGGYTGQELIEKYNLNPNLSEADAYADLARRYQADKGQNPNLTYMMPRPKGSDDSVKSRIAAGQTSSGLDTRIHQEGDEYFTVDGSKIFKGNMKHKYFEYQLDPDTIPPNTKVERLQTVEGKPQKVGEFVHKPSLQGMADGGVVENIDIFSEESMFRDPVYEDLGYTFDPERNEYFEIIDHPEYGRVKSYIQPSDIADQIFQGRRYGLVTELDDSPYSKPGDLAFQRRMDLMAERAEKRRAEEAARRAEQMTPEERKRREKQAEDAFEKSGMVTQLQKGRGYQAGGAVNDIDIFEEELRSMANEPFTMPAQPIDEKSGPNPFGYGSEMKQTGTPGVDQVFTQILFSPEIRAVTRVEDLPPRTLQQAKDTFEYLTKMQGIDKAAEHLLKTFGRVSMNEDTFPILRSIGPDPREQQVTTMTNVRMQTSGEDMFDDRFSKPIQDARQEESRLRDMINQGIGSLTQ